MVVDMAVDTEVGMASASAGAARLGRRLAHFAGGHFRGGHFHRGFRRFGFWGGGLYAYSGYSCWRWYPGIYGYVRVWVC